jgi:hypothetical protein
VSYIRVFWIKKLESFEGKRKRTANLMPKNPKRRLILGRKTKMCCGISRKKD